MPTTGVLTAAITAPTLTPADSAERDQSVALVMAFRNTLAVSMPPPTTTNEITKPAITNGSASRMLPLLAACGWVMVPSEGSASVPPVAQRAMRRGQPATCRRSHASCLRYVEVHGAIDRDRLPVQTAVLQVAVAAGEVQ